MPIIWRYLLNNYLKVLCFCVLSFIAVLMTTRLQDIAHFAALGAQAKFVMLFALYQIPYILPIAIPVSCLISAMILVQRLSSASELTALRASGMPLKEILMPVLLAAGCLSLGNFYIVSEVATDSHLKTRVLEQEIRSINPMLLLENQHLTKLQGIYVNSLGPSKTGISASDLLVALPNRQNHRLSLMIAKQIQTNELQLAGEKISIINTTGSEDRPQFDHLMIENLSTSTASAQDFSAMLGKQSSGRINADYLKLSLLRLRAKEDRAKWEAAQKNQQAQEAAFYMQRLTRAQSEILRRISLGIAAFTFTLMGASFGITIGRKHSYKGVAWVIGLAALFLICFFAGKGMDHSLAPAALLYTAPHLIIIASSIWALHKASRGIE